jgi:hypothetical protein
VVSTSSPEELDGERDPGAAVDLDFGAAPLLLLRRKNVMSLVKTNTQSPSNANAIGFLEKTSKTGDLGGLEGGKEKKLHSRFCGFARFARLCIIGDDGFQVSALSPLLAAVAIGSGRSNTGHLFTLVQHGLCEINALHVVELGKGSWVVEGDHKLRASEREAGHRDARWLVEGGAAEM